MSDRKRLRILRDVAEEASRDPRFRAFVVHEVLAGVQDRDYRSQAAAMLAWVQRNVRYINEPNEQIQTPWRTIKNGFGDCDDMATLLAAMANAVGLPWRFVLAGRMRGSGRPVRYVEGGRYPWGAEFVHIYLRIGWPPGKPAVFLSAEPTIKSATLGYDVIDAENAGRNAGLPELQRYGGWQGSSGTPMLPGGAVPVPVRQAPAGYRTIPGYGNPHQIGYSGASYLPESLPALPPKVGEVVAEVRERMVDPETWVEIAIGVVQSIVMGVIVDRAMRRLE